MKNNKDSAALWLGYYCARLQDSMKLEGFVINICWISSLYKNINNIEL